MSIMRFQFAQPQSEIAWAPGGQDSERDNFHLAALEITVLSQLDGKG